jgi:hypothetical protein
MNRPLHQDTQTDLGATNWDVESPRIGDISDSLDYIQEGLTYAGMTPALGVAPDVLNSLISLGRGEFVDAGINMAAAIPGVGQGVGATKLVNRAKTGRRSFARGVANEAADTLLATGEDETEERALFQSYLDSDALLEAAYGEDTFFNTEGDITTDLKEGEVDFKPIEEMDEFSDIFSKYGSTRYKTVPEVGTYRINDETGESVLLGSSDPNHPMYNKDHLEELKALESYEPPVYNDPNQFKPAGYSSIAGVKG